jgi:hypothetical protein
LIAHLGYQAPITMTAFERAVELAGDIGEPELLMPSIYGLWASRYIAGTPSADLADRVAELTRSGVTAALGAWPSACWRWSVFMRGVTRLRSSS